MYVGDPLACATGYTSPCLQTSTVHIYSTDSVTANMRSMLVLVLVAAAAVHLAESYPFEVAFKACVDMLPKKAAHSNGAEQSSMVPYNFSLDKTSITASDSVEFTISQKPGGKPFAGFMIQVRSGPKSKPLGTFQPKDSNAKTITCSNDNDTGSHNSPEPKESTTLIWTPPTDFKGTAIFYVTVAETKAIFWVMKKAGAVKVL